MSDAATGRSARTFIRRYVPGPIRSLPWRARWLARQASTTSVAQRVGSLMKWTALELAGRDFVFESSRGFRITSPARNFTSFALCMTGENDPEFEAFIAARLRPGDVFLDIGANIGAYSLFAGKLVGDAGRVVSLEAEPSTFAYLAKNIRDNGLANVTCLNRAAGETPGTITIASNAWNAGETHVAAGAERGTKVEAERIDDVVVRLGLPRVDYIKIDVEGFELPVLRGALRTLASNPAVAVQTELVTSHMSRYGHGIGQVCALMAGAGLTPFRIEPDGTATQTREDAIGAHCDIVWMRA